MDKSSTVTNAASGGSQPVTATANRKAGPPEPPSSTSNFTSSAAAALDGEASKVSTASSSLSQSPLASREPSPIRYPRRATSNNRLAGSRSRTNSQQDMSPSRQIKPGVSAPILPPRSLSATTTPTLPPVSQESQTQEATPQKHMAATLESPRWPVSPRLRSPPPLVNKASAGSIRRSDGESSSSSHFQRPHPSLQSGESLYTASESESEDPQLQSGLRTPTRGALETVQEVSLPNSPTPRTDVVLLENLKEKLPNENHSDSAIHDVNMSRARLNLPGQGSGSDGSNRAEARRTTSVPPAPVTRQSSAMSSKQMKGKQESSTQTMTVETETVSSIPQIALVPGPKSEAGANTLKAKPSTETIKPKKDRKKPTRKQPSVNAGNASSKADIFEAQIASAVDEANTSDSEETFVYDSNPPDGVDRPGRRFHSRTPSATSMASQADRQNVRSIYSVIEGGGLAQPPKKNMKFVNTFNGNGVDTLAVCEEDGKGSGRSTGGSTRSTTRHHHHIGRWGRQPGNGHPSLFDNESPFPNAARTRLAGNPSRNSSGPPSPRNNQAPRGHLHSKRSGMQMSASYDLDDGMGADDERTPLMASARSGRTIRNRPRPHTLRQVESQSFSRRSSYLNRFAACLVLTMMFLLVITGAIGFMFATSQPMTDIEVVSINNVVTSEQVLMFDITVKAHNPNIVVVTIDHANLEIFAKSEHAGNASDWRDDDLEGLDVHLLDDPVNDPPRDPDDDDDQKPNILLGRITEFDSPLTFEGSLFHQGSSSSTGEMQLANPGNDTTGGSRRWERIYQNEFDLIVKGVVKYSLPLSARIRSATVSGRTVVKPNSANDPSLRPNTTTDTT